MDSYNVDEPGFWRPSTIAAGVVLLLVLIAGAVLLVVRTGGGSSASQPTAAQPSPATSSPVGGTSATTSTTSVATQTGCSLPAGSQAVPEMTPQGINWQLYQTVALPYSTADGPQIVDGDIARCYAHNPVGALIAASQLSVRYAVGPDVRQVLQEQVMPGPGRDAALQQTSRPTSIPSGGSYGQFAGFKFVTYSPAVAVVEFVSKAPDASEVALPVTVDWSDGDWKLQLQPDGSESPNALPVTSLVGFSTWSGE